MSETPRPVECFVPTHYDVEVRPAGSEEWSVAFEREVGGRTLEWRSGRCPATFSTADEGGGCAPIVGEDNSSSADGG